MSELAFKTWHAQTLSLLQFIPGITPLLNRFSEIPHNIVTLPTKVKEAREVLTSIVQCINSPLFAVSITATHPLSQSHAIYFAPQMTQMQSVIQPITPDLNTLLERLDAYTDLSPENKEAAKGLVRQLWQHIIGRAKDAAPIIDIGVRLASLGVNITQILQGLRLGQ
jgi:hypothetical protein